MCFSNFALALLINYLNPVTNWKGAYFLSVYKERYQNNSHFSLFLVNYRRLKLSLSHRKRSSKVTSYNCKKKKKLFAAFKNLSLCQHKMTTLKNRYVSQTLRAFKFINDYSSEKTFSHLSLHCQLNK